MTPAFASQAMKAMSETSNAVPAASARKARRIAAGNLAKRRADDQRNCGSNGNGGVARTAKDPEDQSAEQAGVKAGFRRQIG